MLCSSYVEAYSLNAVRYRRFGIILPESLRVIGVKDISQSTCEDSANRVTWLNGAIAGGGVVMVPKYRLDFF